MIAKRVFRVDFVTEDKTAKLNFPCNGKIRLQIKYLYTAYLPVTQYFQRPGGKGVFFYLTFLQYFSRPNLQVTGVTVLLTIVLSECSNSLLILIRNSGQGG